MTFEERFPRTSKWIRLIGSLVVPLVVMAGPFTFAFTGSVVHGSPDDFPPGSFDRAFLVVAFSVLAAAVGAWAATIAHPHRVEAPAATAALALAGTALFTLVPEWLEWGYPELVPFTYAFVIPAAYLLGALVWQRRKRRLAETDRAPADAGDGAGGGPSG